MKTKKSTNINIETKMKETSSEKQSPVQLSEKYANDRF